MTETHGAGTLFLIDGTAPFFCVRAPGTQTNWSKIPFRLLERNGRLDPDACALVSLRFEQFVKRVSALGFNAITLDDLAHLAPHDFYSSDLLALIEQYCELYHRLVALAGAHGMRVFVTTDLMFFNDCIERHTRHSDTSLRRLLTRSLRVLFERFPNIAGVVVRLGECDGDDVDGDFHSRLVIRTSVQCRQWVRAMVGVAEHFGRELIVRTWTLGAHPVGDLMWNPATFRAVFDGIESDSLIVSHKHGESDFFRYLQFNPLFLEGTQRQLLELQARREYEGFGQFPVFAGFDHERYRRYLSSCENVAGISVWCQTGGWSHFDDITFLQHSSLWNELNVYATIRIFRDGWSAEQALIAFATEHFPGAPPITLVDLMRLSDRVIRELWYLPEFSRRRLYFRRTRVPPLLWVFWNNVLINHTLRKVIRRLVHARHEAITDGYRALQKIRTMSKLGAKLGIGPDVFEYQYRTFQLLAAARQYYLGPWDPRFAVKLNQLAAAYRSAYPQGFRVLDDFTPVKFRKHLVKLIFATCVRDRPAYRLFDTLFLTRFASLIYPLVRRFGRGLPSFAREQAMGIQVFFK